MTGLTPLPLGVLVNRLFQELEDKKAVYDLRRSRFFKPDTTLDLSVSIHGQEASTPFGPAAGPHTQLAQNILLSWLAGGRVIELKTVQILDQLEIMRPCIDMETIGFNIEWSQELTLEQSLEEYVKAAMLIEMAKSAGLGGDAADTVFDLSVGYDLAGISSPRVRAFMEGLKDASAVIERLRREIPDSHAHLRELVYPTQISKTVTLSTFHGCPPQEIETIAAHLMREVGLDVVVKLNPTLLGETDLNAILHDRLGYHDLEVPRETFAKDATWGEMVGIVKRLGDLADILGRGFGVKFTNTLLVKNHRSFFPTDAREMYLSGAPLHVLAIALVDRFRSEFGDRFPISFSAGIDAGNFAESVALGLKPVSVCTDLLKRRGYARAFDYFKALQERMNALAVADIDTYVVKAFDQGEAALETLVLPPETAEACRAAIADGGDLRAAAGDSFDDWASAARRLNTRIYAKKVLADPRYGADATATPPEKTDAVLDLLDCQTCDRCVFVCPNDAIFRIPLPKAPIPQERLVPVDSGWRVETADDLPVRREHQIGIFADACNECGNCDVICPEKGAPSTIKPQFFGSLATWKTSPHRDGFVVERRADGLRVHGRWAGDILTLDSSDEGMLHYRGPGFDLTIDPADLEKTQGTAAQPVDLGRMRILHRLTQAVMADDAVNYVSAAFR
ncbi:hypothetical protein [Consotaella aegiceratis]|uniref:hypothetical protein n=1 Tax=Consotaella aegiceratis TaxID=3097961 RepID=UPI002F417F31